MRRPFALMTAAAVTAGGLTLAAPASPATTEAGTLRSPGQASPAAQLNNIQRTEVCFTVHNIGDPVDQQVSGTLFHKESYTGGGTALLLQHGSVSERSVWDGGRPGITGAVSMADLFAEAGYVVFAVDRLGYGKSPYLDVLGQEYEGSGWRLTAYSYVEMTHEMVTQIRSGTYRITTDTCASAVPAGRLASKVVLMGTSGGGFITEFYATRYHDIDGIVPMAIGDGAGNRFIEEIIVPIVKQQWARGEDYVYFWEPDPEIDPNGMQLCKDHLFYADGVGEEVIAQVCGPGYFGRAEPPTSPSGEVSTGVEAALDFFSTVGNVGPTPVLSVYADKDVLIPNAETPPYGPDNNKEDPDKVSSNMETWTTWNGNGCNCDVEFLWQRNSNHANTIHDSAAELTADVIEWLRSRGL